MASTRLHSFNPALVEPNAPYNATSKASLLRWTWPLVPFACWRCFGQVQQSRLRCKRGNCECVSYHRIMCATTNIDFLMYVRMDTGVIVEANFGNYQTILENVRVDLLPCVLSKVSIHTFHSYKCVFVIRERCGLVCKSMGVYREWRTRSGQSWNMPLQPWVFAFASTTDRLVRDMTIGILNAPLIDVDRMYRTVRKKGKCCECTVSIYLRTCTYHDDSLRLHVSLQQSASEWGKVANKHPIPLRQRFYILLLLRQ